MYVLYIYIYIHIYIYIYICNSSKILNQRAQWVERFIYLLMMRYNSNIYPTLSFMRESNHH